jgi:ferric-dicitrate binding protein FerR (iron transport regulator)
LRFEHEELSWVVDLLNLYGPTRFVLDDPSITDIRVVGRFNAVDVDPLLQAFAELGVRSRRVSREGSEEIHLFSEAAAPR